MQVFFYGLFMDHQLLQAKGLQPRRPQLASVDGFMIHIGQRAALVPRRGARVHGVIMSLTQAELQTLYSEPGVLAYKPEPVLARLVNGRSRQVLCYNLPEPAASTESNPEYVARLRAVAERVGLPAEYVATLQ